MNRYAILIGRWALWALLLSFESVIGLPWLAFFIAEWVFAEKEMTFLSLAVMGTLLAATYGVSWVAGCVCVIAVWQIIVRTRRKSPSRWVGLVAVVAFVGFAARVPLTAFTLSTSALELLLVLRLSQGTFLKESWQKIKQIPSSEM